MKKPTKIFIALLLCLSLGLFLLGRCGALDRPGNNGDGENLVIYTSHPIELISRIVREFEARTGIRVKLVRGGTGEMIRKIDEERAEPEADILWGGSLSTLTPHKSLSGLPLGERRRAAPGIQNKDGL